MASNHSNTTTSDFRPVSGRDETCEPGGGGGDGTSNSPANTSAQRRHASQAPPPPLRKQSSSSLIAPPTTASGASSPHTSRNTSPIRKDSRPSTLAANISSQPSAAAIQRALSATSVPQLQSGPVSEAVLRLPRSAKSTGSGEATPQWPISPRVKSPPPSAAGSRRASAITGKMADQSPALGISVQAATPQTSVSPKPTGDDGKRMEQQPQALAKAPSRGPSGKSMLETVQENTGDAVESSPAALQASADLKAETNGEDKTPKMKETPDADKAGQPAESGSESAGNKSDSKRGRRSSTSQPSAALAKPKTGTKNSYTGLSSAKSRQGEGKQNMTVETETVASVPQSALNGPGERNGVGRGENSGSLRLKPSTETIRPKKERKKPSQKSRSINQSTASSKADIFEQRVANAVDEANASDSDDTFVYESNPPDTARRPRHHSRTPSVTSSHSTAEQRSGIRNFGDMMDDRKVAGKRSMKFASNLDIDSPDSKNGTVRSHHAKHIGKFGRGGSHASVMDQDSPFTQASKPRNTHLGSITSRPASPRSPNQNIPRKHSGLFSRKQEQSFDFDGEGADDERTPLIGTVRTPRGARHARRLHSGNAQNTDEYYGNQDRSSRCCGRIGGCCLAILVTIAVVGVTVFITFMSNRPLQHIKIRRMENVLATEQEVMLDAIVAAVNPNALTVTITDMDVMVFAKSKHASSKHPALTTSESFSVRRGRQRRTAAPDTTSADDASAWKDLSNHWRTPSISGGVDHGTDPMPPDDDEESDESTMLLGRVTHFDEPLVFNSQVFSSRPQISKGSLQLMQPGNKTEPHGSARWEIIIQHPFTLIIRGILKYQLPVSTRMQSVAVETSVLVHPEDGVDDLGRMRVEPVKDEAGKEHWQWIDWEEMGDEEEMGRVVGEVFE